MWPPVARIVHVYDAISMLNSVRGTQFYAGSVPLSATDDTRTWPGLSTAMSAVAISIGLSVLAGWIFDIAMLKSIIPGLRVMVPNSALCFVFAGLALLLTEPRDTREDWRRQIAFVLSVVVVVLGGITILEYLTGLRLGVEGWLLSPAAEGPYAGRMSPQTAINFVLVGTALLLLRSPRLRTGFAADTLSLAVLLVSWLALASYSYDITTLYDVPRYPGHALHTVFGFVALSIGLLFSHRNALVGRFLSEGAGGTMLRRFLPAALLIPLMLGWMRIAGEDAGWYDDPLGLVFLSIAFTTVLVVLVWASAGAVARMELRRQDAELALRHAYDHLDEQVAQRTAQLGQANESLRYEIGRREQIEASRRASERWFQDLFDRAPDSMCSFDATSGEILECNQTMADTLGYRKEELLGRSVLELCDPDSRTAAAALLAAFMRREPVHDQDLCLRRQDRSVLDVSLSMSAVTDEAGQIIRIRSIWRDITARRLAQQVQSDLLAREQEGRRRAEEADRLKDEFLATVSHELRAPLNPILGWVHVLRQGALPANVYERALTTIDRSARVQKQLVEDLLDASRITSGKLHLVMSRVDIATIVETAVDATRPTAAAKDIGVVTEPDSDTGLVLGDPERLHQIVWNLVGNAIKFTPPGGKVSVQIGRRAGIVQIVVTDTGPGIEAGFLPYLFDRFRQGDGSTTRRHGGLGLGLSIVRHLVELHGGEVRAQNVSEGTGAIFIVTLPALVDLRDDSLTPTHSPQREAVQPGNGAATLASSPRVLVVDDDPEARDLLVAILTHHGARVEAVEGAAPAMAQLVAPNGDAPFDAIVCDIGMPDEDGYSFIRRVRSLLNPRLNQTPAIALTGYARRDDRLRAIAAGFQLHLTKPVEADELIRAIGALTRRPAGSHLRAPLT
jgi:PAS domain S-box-containing protein